MQNQGFNMETKKSNITFPPVLVIIGSVLSFLTVLPFISDNFPLISASGTISGYPATLIINFWGAKESVLGTTVWVDIVNNWTALGLPTILMFLIYASIGVIGIIFGIDGIKKFIAI